MGLALPPSFALWGVLVGKGEARRNLKQMLARLDVIRQVLEPYPRAQVRQITIGQSTKYPPKVLVCAATFDAIAEGREVETYDQGGHELRVCRIELGVEIHSRLDDQGANAWRDVQKRQRQRRTVPIQTVRRVARKPPKGEP